MNTADATLPGMEFDLLIETPKTSYPFSDEEWDAMIEHLFDYAQDYDKQRVGETVSDWMERKMVLADGQSVYPGRFTFGVTPYLREIADNLSNRSPVTEMAVIKGNQLGFSTISHGHMGYCIDYGVGPGLFISGDATMAEEQFEQRVYAVIYEANLQDKIKPVVQRKANKTTGEKKGMISYGGTFIRAVGPRSEGKLRSFPSRIIHVEELDVFPQNLANRGNPIEKAVRRSDTYGPLRRIYYNSTPKLAATSQIEPLYEAGDKREYRVPCPVCGHKQALIWDQLKWDKNEDGSPAMEIDAETGEVLKDPTYYECVECGAHWKNSDKYRILKDRKAGGMTLPDGTTTWAEWVPTKAPDRPGLRSYKMPSLYSPFRSWLDVAVQWWRVHKDPMMLPDFINDVLAETWKESSAAPKPHVLQERAEDWETGTIPAGILFTTMAADVQADRLEIGLSGWGKDGEWWHLNYWVFHGHTHRTDSECWQKFDRLIQTEWTRDDGKNIGTPIVTFIDSGFLPSVVNDFCDRFVYNDGMIDGVYPIAGDAKLGARVYRVDKNNDIATPRISLHDQKLKKALYSILKREKSDKHAEHPMRTVHFPKSYGKDYYEQLTAEEWFIERDSKGRKVSVIENRKGRRNEVLDVAKYNLAALYFIALRMNEIENERRRKRHRRERPMDWDLFWALWDE